MNSSYGHYAYGESNGNQRNFNESTRTGDDDDDDDDDDSAYTGIANPSRFLARLLSFLETPPHLRRALFPLHPDLRTAGMLPSLAMPHHLKADEWCPYREGVVVPGISDGEGNAATIAGKNGHGHDGGHAGSREDVDMDISVSSDPHWTKKTKKERREKKDKKGHSKSHSAAGAEAEAAMPTPHLVNVGFTNPLTVNLPASLPPFTRLTLHLTSPSISASATASDLSRMSTNTINTAHITALPVPPTEPRNTGGYYWGYTVRQASNLSAIFTECPYAGGYDVSFGTSERGIPLSSLAATAISGSSEDSGPRDSLDTSPLTSTFRHLLLVFGGVAGLEKALEGDELLSGRRKGEGFVNGYGSGNGNGSGSGRGGDRADTTTAAAAAAAAGTASAPAVNDVSELFDFWVNLVPGQGSRTIRTEEAVWVGLMGIKSLVDGVVERKEM